MTTKRPNGNRLMLAGKLAVLAAILAGLTNAFRRSLPIVFNYDWMYDILQIATIFGLLLGAAAWLVGYLVFALSFTVGKDE